MSNQISLSDIQRVEPYVIQASDSTWVASDPHFDHSNIIKYCDRPFSSTEEMNEAILANWKALIQPDDLVFFLGDMSFGRGSRKPRWWLSQLPGHIVYVKGSHDHGIRPTSPGNALSVSDFVVVQMGSLKVLLVHNPEDPVSQVWQGLDTPITYTRWVIHGHVHNNKPHWDTAHRRVNVSMDVTDFQPVSLNTTMNTISYEYYKTDCNKELL